MDSIRIIFSSVMAVLLPIAAVAQEPFAAPLPQVVLADRAETAVPRPDGPVAHLFFHVLEFDESKIKEAEAIITELFPTIKDAEAKGAISLGAESGKRTAQLIAKLVDQKLVTVISRPQVMTVAERTAEVEVGQQIEGLPTTDGTAPTPRQLGLTLQCVAHWLGNPNQMRLDINCTHARVNHDASITIEGKLYPAINKLRLETTLAVSCGETILLHGPAQNMFVAVTPSWVLNRPAPAVTHPVRKQSEPVALAAGLLPKNVDATSPTRAPSAHKTSAIGPTPPVRQARYSPQPISALESDRASMIGDLVKIQNSLRSVSGATIRNLSVEGDKLEVEIALADDAKINELAEVMSSHDQIKMNSILLVHPGTGAIISIKGQITKPEPKPHTRDEEMQMLRADVKAIRDELRQMSQQLQDR